MKYLLLVIVTLLTSNSGYSEDIKGENATSLQFFEIGPLPAHWKIGYSAENKEQTVHEYITNGESVHKWTQLITEQCLKNIPAELLPKYVAMVKDQPEKTSKGFVWKILKKSENSITYEWTHQGSGKFPPTYEITKLVVSKGNLFRIAYDKYTKTPDKDTHHWKALILKSKFK